MNPVSTRKISAGPILVRRVALNLVLGILMGSVVNLFSRPGEGSVAVEGISDIVLRPASLRYVVNTFCLQRRDMMDVLWLKENAEFLNILDSENATLESDCLDVYEPFYQGSRRHLEFFHSYYRFILSITMDLEDLGMPGTRGEELANWVSKRGFLERELSDLQRAEMRRLLMRRGVNFDGSETAAVGLDDRLRSFLRNAPAFAVQNRKTAYELTHIVFYLSEYGSKNPELDADSRQSLTYVGLLAFLDQDPDLLSEICLALTYAQAPVPEAWVSWLQAQEKAVKMSAHMANPGGIDDYHTYFVLNWSLSKVVNRSLFGSFSPEARYFTCAPCSGALRSMSMVLYTLTGAAVRDWTVAQRQIEAQLSQHERGVLRAARDSVDDFDAFFADFTRRGVCTV